MDIASWWDSAAEGMVETPHKPVPAPFLTKTYQLVDDTATDHIVSWGDDDRLSTFVVWRPPEFARDILPNFFKHNNFSSFVRQLNTYGFRKVVPERWEFANEFFRKGEKRLLCEIHRRKSAVASPSLPLPPSPALFPLYPRQHFDEHHASASPRFLVLGSVGRITDTVIRGGEGGTATTAALEENERLRRSNTALLSELAHMRQLYSDIIYFVQNHVPPVAPSSAAAPSARFLLSGAAAACSNQRQVMAVAINSGGSTTSSSSLTIAEEGPSPPSNGSESSSVRPKLFGVALDGCRSSSTSNSKRALLQAESPSSALTKPRLVLQEMDLDFNITPPSSSPPHC